MTLPNFQKVLWGSKSRLHGALCLPSRLGTFWMKSLRLAQAIVLMLRPYNRARPVAWPPPSLPATQASIQNSPPPAVLISFCWAAPVEWTTVGTQSQKTQAFTLLKSMHSKRAHLLIPQSEFPLLDLTAFSIQKGNLNNSLAPDFFHFSLALSNSSSKFSDMNNTFIHFGFGSLQKQVHDLPNLNLRFCIIKILIPSIEAHPSVLSTSYIQLRAKTCWLFVPLNRSRFVSCRAVPTTTSVSQLE